MGSLDNRLDLLIVPTGPSIREDAFRAGMAREIIHEYSPKYTIISGQENPINWKIVNNPEVSEFLEELKTKDFSIVNRVLRNLGKSKKEFFSYLYFGSQIFNIYRNLKDLKTEIIFETGSSDSIENLYSSIARIKKLIQEKELPDNKRLNLSIATSPLHFRTYREIIFPDFNDIGLVDNIDLVDLTNYYTGQHKGPRWEIYSFFHRLENEGKLSYGVEYYLNEKKERSLSKLKEHLVYISRGIKS